MLTVNDDLIHDVVLAYQQNQHTGSSNTLTRAEVRGGGKKPWKQKQHRPRQARVHQVAHMERRRGHVRAEAGKVEDKDKPGREE